MARPRILPHSWSDYGFYIWFGPDDQDCELIAHPEEYGLSDYEINMLRRRMGFGD